VICLAVPAVRTSGMTAGEVASSQNTHSRLAAASSSNRTAVLQVPRFRLAAARRRESHQGTNAVHDVPSSGRTQLTLDSSPPP
jgi:hypothetical protein